MVLLLLEADRLQFLDQAQVLGKPAPGHQKGMLSVLDGYFAVAHDRSLLQWVYS